MQFRRIAEKTYRVWVYRTRCKGVTHVFSFMFTEKLLFLQNKSKESSVSELL